LQRGVIELIREVNSGGKKEFDESIHGSMLIIGANRFCKFAQLEAVVLLEAQPAYETNNRIEM